MRCVRSGASWCAVVGLALGACAQSRDVGAGRLVSYAADVEPILQRHCVECHTEGGIAPMPLRSYADAKLWAKAIKRQVVSRNMPPWPAGPDCNEYIGDRSLSDEQIDAISRWVDEGTPKGTVSEQAAVESERGQEPEDEFRLDVELEMAEDYVPNRVPDDYRCFVLPWPKETPTYITGLGLKPGNREVVHHSVLTLVAPDDAQGFLDRDAQDPGPGYECFTTAISGGQAIEGGQLAGATMTRSSLLGAFEKPEAGQHFPHGTGIRVEPGSLIILQQHYNWLRPGEPESDRSSVQIMVEDEVENPGRAVWLLNPLWENPSTRDTMHIAAGDPDASVNVTLPGTFVAGTQSFDLYWADLHMHTLGSKGRLEVVHADGSRECLLRVDNWKFEWQTTFFLKDPNRIGPGDSLYLECHWDNTADNQYIVDGERLPVQDVWWGDGSRDEMCLGNFLIVPR